MPAKTTNDGAFSVGFAKVSSSVEFKSCCAISVLVDSPENASSRTMRTFSSEGNVVPTEPLMMPCSVCHAFAVLLTTRP